MSALREDQVLILAAGMPRSGSTWLYNAVRLLLAARPGVAGDLGCGWIADWDTIPHRKYLLVKLHNYDVGAVVMSRAVFYSYRDVRDAIASQKRRFGGTPDMLWADMYIHQHELWMQQACYAMKYENLLEDQAGVVADILSVLDSNELLPPSPATRPDPSAIARELRRLAEHPAPDESRGYDRTTLYHPSHITDGRTGSWVGWLDADLVIRISEKYGWWLEKYGYPTGPEIVPPGC